MTDLIERLRTLSRPGGGGDIGNEAADEIERLRTELANVNNEFGSQTADWPSAWKRVAELKQIMNDRWHEIERLRAALSEVLEFQSAKSVPSIHDWGRWRRARDGTPDAAMKGST